MKKITLYAVCLWVIAVTAQAQTILKANDPHIHYMGRVLTTADNAQIQWSGTSVKFNFNGTSVKANLKDEKGGNGFNIIIDGEVTKIITLDKDDKEYTLAENLPVGNHSLELFKRTEAENGKTW